MASTLAMTTATLTSAALFLIGAAACSSSTGASPVVEDAGDGGDAADAQLPRPPPPGCGFPGTNRGDC